MANELTLFLDAMYTQKSLKHHGVKGMHWGKWNEETRRRRMGYKLTKPEKAATKKARAAARKASASEKVSRNTLAGYLIGGLGGYVVSDLWNKKKYGFSNNTQDSLRNLAAYSIRRNEGAVALKNMRAINKMMAGRKDGNTMTRRNLEIIGSNRLHAAMTQPGNHGNIPTSLVNAYYRGETLRVKEEAQKYLKTYSDVMLAELSK